MSKRSWSSVLVAAAIIGGVVALPAAAGASSLDGCSGTATSLDADGEVIDSASASGGVIVDVQDGSDGATASNPFVIANDGTVTYQGSTDAVITDHTWSVSLLGVEVLSGGSANSQMAQEDQGQYDLGDNVPPFFTGLMRVEGELSGTGGTCTGSGYVRFDGNPLTAPLTWAGFLLVGLGIAGFFSAVPRVRPQTGGPS